jgi:hypothetical protein
MEAHEVSEQSASRSGHPARPTLSANVRDAGSEPRADLELPRLWRLIATAGWNFAESLGLPAAAYLIGAALAGQAVGMVAATSVMWVTAAVRKLARCSVPGMLTISALVLTLQTILVVATGSTLVFLLQFPLANLALCILFARTARSREPLVARLAAEVVGLRQLSSGHPGLLRFFRGVTWLWAAIFAASAAGLAAALAVEPAGFVPLLATVVTVGGIAGGAVLSFFWFKRVLRHFGLSIRLSQT